MVLHTVVANVTCVSVPLRLEHFSQILQNLELTNAKFLPWFQRFIFIIFIAKGRGKINLWLKAAIDSSSHANQFELGSDPDSVS